MRDQPNGAEKFGIREHLPLTADAETVLAAIKAHGVQVGSFFRFDEIAVALPRNRKGNGFDVLRTRGYIKNGFTHELVNGGYGPQQWERMK
ncbi:MULTISPECIES: hypothetical protein [Mycobacteroides]|uniref:hypothetical protein n=1 Tax=Mycobacteroides TaxID=670516 RepID=UPI0008A8D528|nr:MULTISPECIES: hypothetical protein [Mycobacteroides]AYM40361.1 hypothetical protein DYE20_01285 [[Mycobacterium] chelonae subsp. gwanakae]OHU15945.1 hypothetical protein BKG75_12945 [Mycobacteroides chelonae]SHR98645.1 Uncharacterised protein [Mycobacteroides abscessus subsp. abscessus]